MNKYQIVEHNYDNVDLSSHNAYDATEEYAEQIGGFISHLPARAAVLVVGGTSVECNYFFEKGYSVTALDISQAMLDEIHTSNPEVAIIKANIKDFRGNHYDGIWACRALIHIPPGDLVDTLKNIHSLLKPDGIIGAIFFTGAADTFEEQQVPEEHTSAEGVWYYRVVWNPTKLLELFGQAGFNVRKHETCYDADGEEGLYIEASIAYNTTMNRMRSLG